MAGESIPDPVGNIDKNADKSKNLLNDIRKKYALSPYPALGFSAARKLAKIWMVVSVSTIYLTG